MRYGQEHVKRPLNMFLLFAQDNRSRLLAACRPPPGTSVRTVLDQFAARTFVPLVEDTPPARIKPAHLRPADWLDTLELAVDGNWAAVKTVPNNTVSSMLSRLWSWTLLTQPKVAKRYADAQEAAKRAHREQYPDYKYSPVQPLQAGRAKTRAKAHARQRSAAAAAARQKAIEAAVLTLPALELIDPHSAGIEWTSMAGAGDGALDGVLF